MHYSQWPPEAISEFLKFFREHGGLLLYAMIIPPPPEIKFCITPYMHLHPPFKMSGYRPTYVVN